MQPAVAACKPEPLQLGNRQPRAGAGAMAITTTQITWQQTQLSFSSGYVYIFACSCWRCEATQAWTWSAGGLCPAVLLRRMLHIKHKEYAQNSTPLLPFYLFLMALLLCVAASVLRLCRFIAGTQRHRSPAPCLPCAAPSPCS